MQMVRLDTEMQNAEPRGASGSQSVSRGDEETSVSEGGDGGTGAQRHVDRAMPVVSDAPAVRHGSTSGCGLAAGAATPSTPGSNGKVELLACATRCHLN
jgi:hypothetical protein